MSSVFTQVWERIGEGAHIDPVTTLLIDDDAFKAELNPPFTAIHPPVFSHAACQTPGCVHCVGVGVRGPWCVLCVFVYG